MMRLVQWLARKSLQCLGIRVAGRQGHCDNVEAEPTSQYYQRSIPVFLSGIDDLNSSLRERFNDNLSFFCVAFHLAS